MIRFAFFAAVLGLSACVSGSGGAGAAVHDLQMTRKGNEFPVVTGTLVNSSDARLASADVFLTIYDENNVPYPEPRLVQVRGVASGDSARFTERLDIQARRVSVKYIAAN